MLKRDAIIEKLAQHKHLLRKYSVKEIRLFGSIARGDSSAGSDVDILVEFESEAQIGLFEFLRLRNELSRVLACDVDLVTPDALHADMKAEIFKEAIRAA